MGIKIEYIATYAKTRELINKFGFSVKKNYGQNFLIDLHVLNKIVASSELTKDDLVLEIGPGFGGLTQVLAEKAGRVVAIEIDKKLIPILEDTLKDFDNVDIINADVLKIDMMEIVSRYQFKNIKIIANLPYYITTPIIMMILENKYPVQSIIVMVQKEVAERMKASPGTKDFGALSLAVQYYASPYLVANVPENCFLPRPNVDSAVIKFTRLEKPAVDVVDDVFMFKIIKSAFQMRRKTLVNCLFSADFLDFSKQQLAEILESVGLDEMVRGETLGLAEYSRLSDKLLSYK